jgi:hypothetical protein
MKTKIEVSHYLNLMKKMGIDPNFYVSEPYLRLSNVDCFIEHGVTWVEVGDWKLFPPLIYDMNTVIVVPEFDKIWTDFASNFTFSSVFLTFFDWEYIFNPNSFKDLSGKKWEVFRKNIRKWPRNNPNWIYTGHINKEECLKLLGYWLDEKSETAQDAELMIKFIENDEGIEKMCLYKDGKLVAINIWDENYKYVNYRYCIVDHTEPFLDEFVRYLFYTDLVILKTGKLVNDGGTVGNIGLERFKDKLNPIRKRKVYSYIK